MIQTPLRSRWLLAGLTLVALTFAADTRLQADDKAPQSAQPAATAPQAEPYDLWKTKKLTGDWGGARTSLEDSGIKISLVYNQQYMVNMRGGLETKNGNDFAGSYELSVVLDFDKMGLIPGGSFFIRPAKGTWGGEASDFDKEKIGGLFKTNGDAGTEEPVYVDKWWYRQRLSDDRIEFRVGRIDTKKDLFDRNKIAGSEDIQFMNAALVADPTIPHKHGLGIYANTWPTDWLWVRAAIVDPEARARRTGFDTGFHGEDRVRGFLEVGLAPRFDSANGKLLGHYHLGAWYRPHPKAEYRNDLGGLLAPRSRSGDVGFYFGCDQLVWKENAEPKDKQGLSMFARYGYAHDDVNRIEHFWSIGGQYRGVFEGRDKDVLGLGVAQAILSDQYGDEVHDGADRETVYELYYAYQLTPWCVFTPDLQFVTNPGGDQDDRDAIVAGLRFRVTF
ncbi:MAG: carbohydrate porin [Phycisphaerales bacterium]|nr:MAG: carbohydrate porin [Phycisphaerales bacterium]